MTHRIRLVIVVAVCTLTLQAVADSPAAEWREYLAVVESETVEEAFERLGGPFPSTRLQAMQLSLRTGEPLNTAQELLADDPRMRAVRRAIGRAEAGRKAELTAALVDSLAAVLEARGALDELPRPGGDPSGIPLIVLAAQYDANGDALPILVAWFEAEAAGSGSSNIVMGSEAHFALAAIQAVTARLDDPGATPDFTRSVRAMWLEDPSPHRQGEIIEAARRHMPGGIDEE